MGLGNTILILALLPVYGFGIGLHLDLIDKGEMFHIQDLVENVDLQSQNDSLLSNAFMSSSVEGLIQHAYVDLGLKKVLVDPSPNEPGSGDEYFDNLINECSFHSDDSIDECTDIVCKILDTHVQPCADLWLDFQNLDDGTDEAGINAALAGFGVTVKGVANDDKPDGLYVWDADEQHTNLNGNSNEDNDIESPGGLGGGFCNFCDGLHLLIFADDNNGVDPMDDSADGGTITWTFTIPVFWASFDIADIENDEDAVAKAYSNTLPNGECDPNSIIKEVPIPKVENDGDGLTVFVNANHVKCATVTYDDSGGTTNYDFLCIKKVDHDAILAKGLIELENGYTGSDKVIIPFDEPADVQEAVSIVIKVFSCEPPQYRSQTPGGWGTKCPESMPPDQPGCYRDANFDDAFPDDLIVGFDAADPIHDAEFTVSSAVRDYLPDGGTPGAFTIDYTNPATTSARTFGSQVTALSLNVGFDTCSRVSTCDPFAPPGTAIPLAELEVVDNASACFGMTVQDVLDEANLKISGQFSSLSITELNTCATNINENYVDGIIDNGFLGLP